MNSKTNPFRPSRSLAIFFLLLAQLSAVSISSAATYHVDAVNGSDASGDGSETSPYESLDALDGVLAGGDRVVLYGGNYGAMRYANLNNHLFSDWVEFVAADGYLPELDSVVLHSNSGGTEGQGTYDAYVRLKGLHIRGVGVTESINIGNVRHIDIDDCLIEIEGPWSQSALNIEKTAFYMRGGTDITIQNCEFTRTGTAISVRAYDVKILNNHIHDITHDAIRLTGVVDALVEGNLIHDSDDGVDNEDPEGDGWNRHCDGIHIFIMGAGSADQLQPNLNVTIRKNIIFNFESMGIQFNNYGPFPSVHNANILVENNILGPVRTPNAFNCQTITDNLVFRHNTLIEVESGREYRSPYNGMDRTIVYANAGIEINGASSGLQVYNNILNFRWGWPVDTADVWDYNFIDVWEGAGKIGGPNTLNSVFSPFEYPDEVNGILWERSLAVDAATVTLPGPSDDIFGFPRDASPDVGAYELGSTTEFAPILGRVGRVFVEAGQTTVVPITVVDLNGDTISFTPSGLPDFASFSLDSNGYGVITLEPVAGDEGTYEGISVFASDGALDDSMTFSVIVGEEVVEEPSIIELVAHWPMDGNTDDISGNGFDGTLNANASFDSAAAEGTHALNVGGGNDAMVVPDSEALRLDGDVSFAFYVKQDTFGGNFFSKDMNDGYRLRTLSDGRLQLIFGVPESGPNQVVGVQSPFSLTPGQWHHVAITADLVDGGYEVDFYLDFVHEGTEVMNIAGIEAGTGDLVIGAARVGREPTIAKIDDLRIYKGVLSASDVALIGMDTWGGYLIHSNEGGQEWVETGDWIGTLMLNEAPWLYSWRLRSWVYMPEPDEYAPGAWGYIYGK